MNTLIKTDKAPGAVGPYSQGIAADNFVFVSGQLPLDPQSGKFPDGIKAQTRQSLENVRSVLQAAGLELDNVVKTTVYLQDMDTFGEMNEVYASFFRDGNYPARSAVEVARLPKNALVEIEVIARR